MKMRIRMIAAPFTSPEPIRIGDVVIISKDRGEYWIEKNWAVQVADDTPAQHEIVAM